MTDVFGQMAGGKMAALKEEMAALRQRLSEVDDEEKKKLIRRELMNVETNYNILADRMRLQH